MRQSPFIWLGSGRSRKRGVSRKGRLLDEATRAGLPVPSGGILLDEFYRICLAEGLAELVGDVIVITDPVWLHEVLYRDVRFPRLKKEVAVRSAKAVHGKWNQSGKSTYLGVNFGDPVQLAKALRHTWSTMNGVDDGQSMDVLVMEMVVIQTAGQALSMFDSEEDLVRLSSGADGAKVDNLTLARLRPFQRTSREMAPYAHRLQKLLRGVRRSFGRGDWNVDWADDGEICWVLQIH